MLPCCTGMRYRQPLASISRASGKRRVGRCLVRMVGQVVVSSHITCIRSQAQLEGKDLRNAGLKVTLPRLKILEILEDGSARHQSAEDIYKALLKSNEDIGLATVYRVLTQFEAAGLVTRHHFENGMAVFELNHGAHHDHIVCVDCGRVEEFMDAEIEERQHRVAE